MTAHSIMFEREDGAEVEVDFSLSGGHDGSPPSLTDPGEPPEAPEIEIVEARDEYGTVVDLNEVQEAKVQEIIMDQIDRFIDDGPDPDDWRDRMIDDRLTGGDV